MSNHFLDALWADGFCSRDIEKDMTQEEFVRRKLKGILGVNEFYQHSYWTQPEFELAFS